MTHLGGGPDRVTFGLKRIVFDLSPKGRVSQPWEALKEKLPKGGRTSAEVWRLVQGQEVSEAEASKPKADSTPDPAIPLL